MPKRELTRREVVSGVAGATLTPWLAASLKAGFAQGSSYRQSVCRWPYARIPIREFFKAVADMGLTAVDLLTPDEWPIAKEFGLTCSMGSGLGGTIVDGVNDPANHEAIVKGLSEGIPRAAEAGSRT